MRDGVEFIDMDQHVGPNMETLHKYASARLLERWDELVPYFVQVTEGHHLSIDPIPVHARPQHRHRREPDQGRRRRWHDPAAQGGQAQLRRQAGRRGQQRELAGPARRHGHARVSTSP